MTPASEPMVYIVDDDAAVRTALRRLFKSVGIRTETFASASAFLEHEIADAPGCIVLDVRMPRMSGLDLQGELTRRGVNLPVVFITGHGEVPMAVRALKAGAADFLQKPFQDQELIDAVHRAVEQHRQDRATAAEQDELNRRLETLTPREREVFALVVTGLLNKQIAGELGTSEKTVKVHRARVMEKMEAGSLAQLVKISERIEIGPEEPES